jgi:hypothetical protein
MASREGYNPTSILDLIRSCPGLPFELDASLSEYEWLIVTDLRWLPMLVTEDFDAIVDAGDAGIAGTVVFASLQNSDFRGQINPFHLYFSNEL